MITKTVLTGVRIVSSECRRNIGLMAPAMQKASDPIQQLFVDKLRDYKSKSKNGKELVDATPETKKELENELKRVAQQLGAGSGGDMNKFPTFNFEDPKLDSVALEKK